MKTANFPRSVICEYYKEFPFPVTQNDWLISITNHGDKNVDVKKPFDKILFTQFNDTETIGSGGIKSEQAHQIADFIKHARNLKKNVWVNCHAGICRSGAIVMLLGDLGWDIAQHPLIPFRLPNLLVYDSIKRYFPELQQDKWFS